MSSSHGRTPGSPARPTPKSGVDLDRLDVSILRALQRDGRASFRRVAKEVDASVTTVSTRVNRLQRLGVLTGFVPLLSVERLHEAGRPPTCVVCFIRPEKPGPREVARLAARISAQPNVCYVFEVDAGSRLIALCSTASERESRELLAELAQLSGIRSLRAVPIRRVHKERPRHPIPGLRPTEMRRMEHDTAPATA